jgi:hypothetical protein
MSYLYCISYVYISYVPGVMGSVMQTTVSSVSMHIHLRLNS